MRLHEILSTEDITEMVMKAVVSKLKVKPSKHMVSDGLGTNDDEYFHIEYWKPTIFFNVRVRDEGAKFEVTKLILNDDYLQKFRTIDEVVAYIDESYQRVRDGEA